MKWLALLILTGLAHETGHGPAIEGVGPNGGKLSAVVAAEQAELGEAAVPTALGELVDRPDAVELVLLDAVTRMPLPPGEGKRTVKLITLRGAACAPLVTSFEREAFPWRFPRTKGATALEWILQPTAGRGKEVVAFPWSTPGEAPCARGE